MLAEFPPVRYRQVACLAGKPGFVAPELASGLYNAFAVVRICTVSTLTAYTLQQSDPHQPQDVSPGFVP